MATKGRKTTYKKEYCNKVDEYLESTIDKRTGASLEVNIPTLDEFALFIGVPRRTMYDWKAEFEDFSHSLDKIVTEQKKRLINKGLSGEYNSTIAKLILSANHGMKERSDMTSDDKPIGNEIVFKSFDKKNATNSKQ